MKEVMEVRRTNRSAGGVGMYACTTESVQPSLSVTLRSTCCVLREAYILRVESVRRHAGSPFRAFFKRHEVFSFQPSIRL
ncbi:hypothetical protein L596_004154 [Steinernema carpocapsae]|uniref:Uncharacterized protein n=1 Tax=Steinernema carpocapsae TaxID=34508 RepID=A0A4U8UV05_STECR|nr:hypothetical protein L596_004154 [Steinernema carpocapsae]